MKYENYKNFVINYKPFEWEIENNPSEFKSVETYSLGATGKPSIMLKWNPTLTSGIFFKVSIASSNAKPFDTKET